MSATFHDCEIIIRVVMDARPACGAFHRSFKRAPFNMLKRSYIAFWAVICGMSFAMMACAAYGRDDTNLLKDIRETIAKVKEPSSNYMEMGEHLSDLTKSVDPNKIDDEMLGELESLLDSTSDATRYWGAVALGNLGPRAKAVVPKLLKMLPTADCLNGPITSAGGIRYALKRMGVEPPPPPNCPDRISG